MTGLVFLVAILLTPVGLPAALVAQDEPLAFLLVLPLAGLLAIFAAQPPEVAVAELERRAGTQFDPAVVEAVVAVLERPAPATTDEFLERASHGRSDGARETAGAGTLVSEQVEQPL